MEMSRSLRVVLTADALSCFGMGAALVIAAAALSGVFGLDRELVRGAGVILLPIGLFILGIAARKSAPPLFLYAVVAGNTLWVAASLVIGVAAPHITGIGLAFVLVQAAAVTVLTILETVGVMHAQRPLETTL